MDKDTAGSWHLPTDVFVEGEEGIGWGRRGTANDHVLDYSP